MSRTQVSKRLSGTRRCLQIINLSLCVTSEVTHTGTLGRSGQEDDIGTHGSFARDTNIQMKGVVGLAYPTSLKHCGFE